MKRIYLGDINQNCELIPDDPDDVKEAFKALRGKRVEFSIGTLRKHRSLQQNAYYHGVCVKLISDYTGHSPDETHEILKSMFLGKYTEIKTKDGIERVKIIKSTTRLSTIKMEEYLTNIRQWASMSLGLYIPNPSEIEVES